MSVIPFSTDLAALVAFDPELLLHRVRESSSWWRTKPQVDLPELREAALALFPIGREGSYRVRLCQGEVTADEAALVTGVSEPLGLRVESGQVFLGAAERLPGEGRGNIISAIPDTGEVLSLEPGAYRVVVSVLAWRDDDAYYDDDNEVLPDAPADFVVQVTRTEALPALPDALTRLLELLPKAEAKGQAKVRHQPRRRRSSSPEPQRRRRSSSEPRVRAAPRPPQAPRHVPEEVGPYRPDDVAAAFREVLFGTLLHPAPDVPVRRIDLGPYDRNLQRHEVDADKLYQKATRVREQLRVLEGKLNANDALDLAQKVDLQGPVTGVYQALDDLFEFLAAEAPRPAPPGP